MIKQKLVRGFLLGLLTLGAVGPASAALPIVDSQGQSVPRLAPMLQQVLPAVDNITSQGRVRVADNPLMQDPFFCRFFGVLEAPRERLSQSRGSGVIVDAKIGYILTNNHVVDKAEQITVTLKDGRSINATLVGKDPEAAVAVIHIETDKLTAVPAAHWRFSAAS